MTNICEKFRAFPETKLILHHYLYPHGVKGNWHHHSREGAWWFPGLHENIEEVINEYLQVNRPKTIEQTLKYDFILSTLTTENYDYVISQDCFVNLFVFASPQETKSIKYLEETTTVAESSASTFVLYDEYATFSFLVFVTPVYVYPGPELHFPKEDVVIYVLNGSFLLQKICLVTYDFDRFILKQDFQIVIEYQRSNCVLMVNLRQLCPRIKLRYVICCAANEIKGAFSKFLGAKFFDPRLLFKIGAFLIPSQN